MSNTHNRNTLWGAGLAVIALGIAASTRPAAAQAPLLSHPAQVQQAFDDWGHGSDRGRDHGRDRERLRVERERRIEQERRDAERARREAQARHEAEVRHAQWLREHRRGGDRDRHNLYGDWRNDDRR